MQKNLSTIIDDTNPIDPGSRQRCGARLEHGYELDLIAFNSALRRRGHNRRACVSGHAMTSRPAPKQRTPQSSASGSLLAPVQRAAADGQHLWVASQ
jgi:hypothetical protein